MDNIAVVRDGVIILATLLLIAASIMSSLAVWRVYRLARTVWTELEPVVATLKATAESVKQTADFVGAKVVAPSATVAGTAAGAKGLQALLQQLARTLAEDKGKDKAA